ncbi:MAG: hypothetical protein V3573_10095 [Desulfovibrionaceae bacterium]
MTPAPPDKTSPDDILELSELVDKKSADKDGLDADNVDMTFEQELEELFSEDLAADDDSLAPPSAPNKGRNDLSLDDLGDFDAADLLEPAPESGDEEPILLDAPEEPDTEDDPMILEDMALDDAAPEEAEAASDEDDILLLDDISAEPEPEEDEPLILEDMALDEEPPAPAPAEEPSGELDDGIEMILDEVVQEDGEAEQPQEETLPEGDDLDALDLSDLVEADTEGEEEELLDLDEMIAAGQDETVPREDAVASETEQPEEADDVFELSLEDAVNDAVEDTLQAALADAEQAGEIPVSDQDDDVLDLDEELVMDADSADDEDLPFELDETVLSDEQVPDLNAFAGDADEEQPDLLDAADVAIAAAALQKDTADEDTDTLLDGMDIDIGDLDEDAPKEIDDLDQLSPLEESLLDELDKDLDDGFIDELDSPLDTDMAVVMEEEEELDSEQNLHVNVDTLLTEIEAEAGSEESRDAVIAPDLAARLDILEQRLSDIEAMIRSEVARALPAEAARIIREEIQAIQEEFEE